MPWVPGRYGKSSGWWAAAQASYRVKKPHRQDVPVFIIFARIIVVASNPQNRSRPIHHVVQTPQSLLWNFEHYWTIRVGFRQNCETSGNEMTAAAG